MSGYDAVSTGYPSRRTPRRSRRTRRVVVVIAPRTLWLTAAIVALFIITALVVIHALAVLLLLFLAITLAEGIRPLVDWLCMRRVPRALAVLAIYLGIFACVVGLGWLLVQPLLTQSASFVANTPRYVTQLQGLVSQMQEQTRQHPEIGQLLSLGEGQIAGVLSQVAPFLLRVPLVIGELLFSAVVTMVIAFLWLTTLDTLKPFVLGLLPAQHRPLTADVLADMSERIGGYLRGVVFNMVVIGVLSGLGDLMLGVPYPALLGIFAGMTEVIPYFGPWISGAAAVLVALVAVSPLKALEVVLLYVLIQQIEGNTLIPLVMNRTVRLHPLTVVLAALFGTAMLGIVGGVLAVPVAAVVQVVIVSVLVPVARQSAERAAHGTGGFAEATPGTAFESRPAKKGTGRHAQRPASVSAPEPQEPDGSDPEHESRSDLARDG